MNPETAARLRHLVATTADAVAVLARAATELIDVAERRGVTR